MQRAAQAQKASSLREEPWIIVSYTLPVQPTRKRVLAWRHLRKLGALYQDTGIWFLPCTPSAIEGVQAIVTKIAEMGGKAHSFVARDIEPEQSQELRNAYTAVRKDEYLDLLAKCQRFLSHIDRLIQAGQLAFSDVEEMEEDLEKRRRWLTQITARDAFGAEERSSVEAAMKLCEEALAQFVEAASLAE